MKFWQKIKALSVPFWQAFGPYKSRIAFLAVLGLFSGLFEAVGINSLIPLFSFIQSGGAAGDDIVSKAIIWVFSRAHIEVKFLTFLFLIAGLFVLKAFTLLIFN